MIAQIALTILLMTGTKDFGPRSRFPIAPCMVVIENVGGSLQIVRAEDEDKFLPSAVAIPTLSDKGRATIMIALQDSRIQSRGFDRESFRQLLLILPEADAELLFWTIAEKFVPRYKGLTYHDYYRPENFLIYIVASMVFISTPIALLASLFEPTPEMALPLLVVPTSIGAYLFSRFGRRERIQSWYARGGSTRGDFWREDFLNLLDPKRLETLP